MKRSLVAALFAVLVGCGGATEDPPAVAAAGSYRQAPDDLIAGEVMAISYSGFREGQHPDRGDGAVNPSDGEILEDLNILVGHGFRLIRMYDSGANTRDTIELVLAHDLPIKVLPGIWLDAEISNHEGCPWLDEPIPEEKLAAQIDFIGVHTYPVWESKKIDEAMAYTIENIEGVRAALADEPIAILEAGWATTATEFGERANQADQLRYYEEMTEGAAASNTTVFWFEAFDEPWKGDENDRFGAKKHWGLFYVDRTRKLVVKDRPASGG